MEDWYTRDDEDCYYHNRYVVLSVTDNENSLIFEDIQGEEDISSVTFSVQDNIIKAVVTNSSGEKDISYWTKSNVNVDNLGICQNKNSGVKSLSRHLSKFN